MTAIMALLTKVLGSMCSIATLGYLSSADNVAPALLHITFAKRVRMAFSTGGFAAFVAPAAVAVDLLFAVFVN